MGSYSVIQYSASTKGVFAFDGSWGVGGGGGGGLLKSEKIVQRLQVFTCSQTERLTVSTEWNIKLGEASTSYVILVGMNDERSLLALK